MFFAFALTSPFGKKLKEPLMDNNVTRYVGSSMFPTLKTGDILKIVSYKFRDIKVGDVIVFNSTYRKIPIVHRVVFVDNKGVKTKGDNKITIDDCILQPNDITGRVVVAQRGKKEIKILEGLPGRIYASILQAGKRADMVVSTMLRPAYRWSIRSGIIRKLFSRWIRTQVLCFKHGDVIEMQLQLGRRIVGRRLPGQNKWYIQRPFRLFVDELAFPGAQDINKKPS